MAADEGQKRVLELRPRRPAAAHDVRPQASRPPAARRAGEHSVDVLHRHESQHPRLVDRAGQVAVVEHVGEVEEGAGRTRHRDAVAEDHVGPHQRARAMDPHAGHPATARRRDLGPRGPPARHAPQGGGRAVAQHGAGTAGQHGGHRARDGSVRHVADGVDAAVAAVEASDLHPVGDGLPAEPDLPQGHPRDVPVPRDPSDPRVRRRGCVPLVPIIRTGGTHPPEDGVAARSRGALRALSHRPGGWRTTKPPALRGAACQRVPLSPRPLVSKRRPATTMNAWPALA